jgi:hypothetical protein
MRGVFSRKKPLYRVKRYGLGPVAFQLLALLWIGAVIGIADWMELRDRPLFEVALYGGGLVPPGMAFLWNERRASRLKQRDREAAAAAIRQPLRNARQLDDRVVDFDPHYPFVYPNGGLVTALDPHRRMIRMIVPGMIDAQGRALDETGSAGDGIVDVTHQTGPGKRRWLWLLPPRPEDRCTVVTVTTRGKDGQHQTLPFRFRADDPAALSWYYTFQQWMRDGRRS